MLHKKHIHALHIPAETSLCSESLEFLCKISGCDREKLNTVLENASGTLEAHQIRAPTGTCVYVMIH